MAEEEKVNFENVLEKEDEFRFRPSESIDFKSIIYRQLLIIQSKMLEGNINDLISAVNMLEAFLSNYIDDNYIDELREIEIDYERKLEGIENLINSDMIEAEKEKLLLEFAHKKFRALMNLLGRRNLLPVPSYSARIVPNYFHKVDKIYIEEYKITKEELEKCEEEIEEVAEELKKEVEEEVKRIEESEEDEKIPIGEEVSEEELKKLGMI